LEEGGRNTTREESAALHVSEPGAGHANRVLGALNRQSRSHPATRPVGEAVETTVFGVGAGGTLSTPSSVDDRWVARHDFIDVLSGLPMSMATPRLPRLATSHM
jgi:hypothetical protein